MKKVIGYSIVAIVMLVTLSWLYYVHNELNKIVVVDVIQVFNEFRMKKELESSVEKELNMYSDRIDSLTSLYELSIGNKDESRARVIGEDIAYVKMETQRVYEISNKNINELVWKRLNPLIKEFAEKNSYRIVIGANGMGSVLYNKEVTDRTKDLISFINTRYETGN